MSLRPNAISLSFGLFLQFWSRGNHCHPQIDRPIVDLAPDRTFEEPVANSNSETCFGHRQTDA